MKYRQEGTHIISARGKPHMTDYIMTPIDQSQLIEIPFTQAVPNVSWYRHQNWPEGMYKRFHPAHTMTQDITGFTFFNERTSEEK